MTTHELARKLLAGPDLPAVVAFESDYDLNLNYAAVDEVEPLFAQYAVDLNPGNPSTTATGDVIAIL